MRPNSKKSSQQPVLLAALGGGTVLVAAIVVYLYFAAPLSTAQQYLAGAIAGQTTIVQEGTDWAAFKHNIKLQASLEKPNATPNSVVEGVVNALLNTVINTVVDSSTEWFANEVSLTHYIQGVTSYIANGQALHATGEFLNNDTYVLTVTGGRPNKKMWLYFERRNSFSWKVTALKHDS